jgi:hypothetical protein
MPGLRSFRPVVAGVVAAAGVAVAAAGGAFVAPAAAAEPDRPPVQRVLVLSLPGTTWDLLSRAHVPHLDALLDGAALGSTSVRAIHKTTRPGDGYVTIGAGTAAAGVERVDGLAFQALERGPGGPGGDGFRPGAPIAGQPGTIVATGGPDLRRDARQRHRGAAIGALGDALAAAGVARAVIANADSVVGEPGVPNDTPFAPDGGGPAGTATDDELPSVGPFDPSVYHREAAWALADRQGVVPAGEVSRNLLRHDENGVLPRLDPEAVVAAFRTVWERPGRGVVLFEASDLARLHAFHRTIPAGHFFEAESARATLEATDELIGRLLAEVDFDRDAVVVTAPSDPWDGVHLTVAALRGPGVRPGLLDSATTRRAGYVTLPDLGPTVLDLLAVARPDSMEGRPYRVHPRSWADPPVGRFREADREARFRDRMLGPVAGTYVVLEIVLSLVVAYVLARWPRRRGLRRALNAVGLWLMAVVPLTFLGSVLDLDRTGPYLLLVMGGGAVLAAAAARLGGPMRPLAALLGLLLLLHVGDVVTGAHLQISTVFGYSPTVGGRFAGFGNLAFGQVAAAAILLGGITAHMLGGRRGLTVALAILGVALVADGMPFWGADVGGVLACVPAFALVALGLSGRTVSARRLAALAAAGVAAVVALGFVDMARPAEQRTHLGRLFEQIGSDGLRPFTDAVQRKIAENLSVIPTSIWIPLVPSVLAFYAWLAYGSSPRLEAIRFRAPEMRPALVGLFVAAVLGMALNDSGIAVPAMMLGILNPVLVRLALATDKRDLSPGHRL